MNWKKAALTALMRKSSGVNGVEMEKYGAVTVFNRKNSGVNVVEPEK